MTNPVAIIDYKKCKTDKYDSGICAATVECPNKVLRQLAISSLFTPIAFLPWLR